MLTHNAKLCVFSLTLGLGQAFRIGSHRHVSGKNIFSCREKEYKILSDFDQRRRINLKMGGYYSEPDDGRSKIEYDHMIFGLPCKERRIDLTISSDEEKLSFLVLDPVVEEDVGNIADKDAEIITRRLAEYLIARREELVSNKRVLVLGVSSWISLLVTRLGASKVMVWDNEEHETKLRLLEHTDQFLNRRAPKCKLTTFMDGEKLLKENNGDEYIDIDLILLATNVTPEGKDIYMHDFVRRTDAKVLMNRDLIDLFGYHTRINEGIDVHLW